MTRAVGSPAAVHRGLEEYDFVVVGAGPNGLGITAYLAAAGFSVCALEARPELGGGAENVEPEPGYLIDPHATYLYGAAAPIFDQLELHKYGFRMAYNKNKAGAITPDGRGFYAGLYNPDSFNEKNFSLVKEPMVAESLAEMQKMDPTIFRDFLRSLYWTPPFDEEWGVPANELPWVKYMRNNFPIFDPSWVDANVVEMCDTLGLLDPLKSVQMFGAWYNGPNPFWKGMALPGWACNLLMLHSSGVPVGGMHGLIHSVIRCALAHGAKIYANAPVSHILVERGRAVGVAMSDTAGTPGREIRARFGVISGTHVRPTFQDLVPSSALHPTFRERIKQIDLKGGSLYVLHLLVDELPQYDQFGGDLSEEDYPSCVVLNCTTEALLDEMRDVYSLRTHPLDKKNYVVPICVNEIYDRSRKAPDGYLLSPIYLQVPPPEDHRDGPDAVNRDKEKIADNIVEMLCEYSNNITPDKIKKRWINTPRDSEMRNMAFVGGNWYGVRECQDQWWDKRPLPELARYRTPVEGLYLCNHTSYPGGLCLFAVPYNLMHILIEDYDIEMPGWWYPSPWHRTDKEMGALR